MKVIFESFPESVVSALGWTLVHSIWQGTLLGLLSFAGFFLLRNRSAVLRYNLGIIILCLQVLTSVVTFFYYRISTPAKHILSTVGLPSPRSSALVANWQKVDYNLSITTKTQIWLNQHINELVICWMIGAAVLIFRFAGGWIYAEHLRSKARIVMDKEWRARFGLLTAKLDISQSVEFRETTQILMPMVIGILQPVVLIPFGLLSEFSVSQVEAILAHELAHIRRNDYLANMLQSLVEVIFFFHPALWWISEKVRTEREHCCDDIALTVCDDKMSLARALVKVAEWQSAPHLAMAFASKKPLLLQRISRVLGVKQKSDRLRANWPVTIILFTLLASFSMYAVGQKKVNSKEKQVKRHIVKNVQTIANIENIDVEAPDNVEVPEFVEVSSDPVINAHINMVLREHGNDTLNKKIEDNQKKMDLLQAQMEPLQRRMEDLNLQMEKENFEMERYGREMEKLDWKKDKLMESREKLMEKRSALFHTDSKTSQSKLSESDLEKQLEEYEQQIKVQEQQITDFNSQIASVRKEAEAFKENESFRSIRKEIDEINKEIDDLGAEMGLTSFGYINYAPAPPAPVRAPRAPMASQMRGKAALAAPPLPPAPNAVSVPKAAPLPPKPKPPVKK